jgi:hypothetical protein
VAHWWLLLVAGVVLYSVTAVGTTRAYASRRVPRLGFWPDYKGLRTPAWMWASLLVGIFLMVFASGKLTAGDGGYWALFGCAVAVGWAVQIAVVLGHNRRVASTPSTETPLN